MQRDKRPVTLIVNRYGGSLETLRSRLDEWNIPVVLHNGNVTIGEIFLSIKEIGSCSTLIIDSKSLDLLGGEDLVEKLGEIPVLRINVTYPVIRYKNELIFDLNSRYESNLFGHLLYNLEANCGDMSIPNNSVA